MVNENAVVPANLALPAKLVILTLHARPIFPGLFIPMILQDAADIKVIEQAEKQGNMLGLAMIDQDEGTESRAENVHSVGTIAKIVKRMILPNGALNIFISTLKRFQIKKFLRSAPPLISAVEYLENDYSTSNPNEITALMRALISEMKQVAENNPLFTEEMRLNMINIDDPSRIADIIVSILNINRKAQQTALATLDVKERMQQALVHIKREQELLKLQRNIQKQINTKIERSQREYFLREELKAIKKELGMPTDSKHAEYLRFREAIAKLSLEDETAEQVKQELEKFGLMEPASAEYHVTRNYLETIISLPWQRPEPFQIDIRKAQRILDADHYGLDDVKERIIEFLAVHKLKKELRGSIICLVGPPGVGKTSVGRSVARALKRPFFRFSVGGMRDEAEIKGHRRTYVGAMPGKIIQGLKIVKTRSPVFMIDEIDKMGISFQGDPSSALLEVLDPEQNIAFRDHYLDLPFDISTILFICTANTLDSIPRPLLDRMEVIWLAGYTDEEKVAIARKYLAPRSLSRSGLQKGEVTYTRKAFLSIANGYAREAGMRNFEKALDKLHRKIARKVLVDEQELPIAIDDGKLEGYLGKPVFRAEGSRRITRPGMAIGLAWTPLGGATLLIEAISNPGKPGFQLTGQMGDVMQESARIAYTYVRSVARQFDIDDSFFDQGRIHLHIPAGATPKDGPSAGITMASCLLSLATRRKLRQKLAMTGELSLLGDVLPIGGLKEKTIAARRSGMRDIVMPVDNISDMEEIPEHIRRGIEFHPVRTMEDVIQLLW